LCRLKTNNFSGRPNVYKILKAKFLQKLMSQAGLGQGQLIDGPPERFHDLEMSNCTEHWSKNSGFSHWILSNSCPGQEK
jgi:hypothetical protein